MNLNKINSPNLNISSEMITDSEGQNQQIINKSSLNNGDQIIIQETVDVDQVIKSMDDSTMNESEITNQTSNGMTQVGGLSNGQLPSHGQYVHCNRFNGYLGNGRYYSKTANPVMAARNFVQSDCDVALAKSTKCLADYGSNPYCSTANTSTAGKCSPNIVGHSRLYHKHTGFFSPSK
ncbi:hypothetical protein ACTGUN_10015 [Streptococcus suis]